MLKKGFSLIEILLGLALFSAAITTGTMALFSSLRNSRKAAAIAIAKAEGAYALSTIEYEVRFARDMQCPNANSVRITKLSGEVLNYSLSGTSIASDSGNLTSPNVTVTVPNPPCSGLFTCSGNAVAICFEIDNAGGVDVTDKAGPGGGIRFQSQVTYRNMYY